MEIVDCFCGIGPWPRREELQPYNAGQTIELMDRFGVDRALVHGNYVRLGGGTAQRSNKLILESIESHDRFEPVLSCSAGPYDRSPTVDDFFGEMRQCGSRALFFCPDPGMAHPWLYEDLLKGCEDKRVPVLFHVDLTGPDQINTLLESFPCLRMILLGLGYGSDNWLYPLLRRHENLSVCLGHYYIPPYGPMKFLDHFSAERLIFGSGLPQFSPGGLISHVSYADISDTDKEKIMSGNITRLLSEVRL